MALSLVASWLIQVNSTGLPVTKFPSLSEPEPAYHGMKFHETFGSLAFTFHGIAIGLRDLGMTLNPQAAHYTLMGIETLSLRMQRHCENAQTVAEWLQKDDRVEGVTYAGLKSSPYFDRVKKVCPQRRRWSFHRCA